MALIGAAAVALATPALAQDRKVVLGALSLTSHAGSYLAYERGYFSDAGLDVELKFFDAAQPMAVAIASGDVDFGVTAISGGLVSLAEKGAVKVIGGALSEEPGIDGQKFLASDAAFQDGVTSPKGLDGRKFGMTTAGSSFQYMGAKMAAAEGIELEFVPLQTVGAVVGALKSGQVDGWAIVPHIAKPLDASGAVHIIGNVSDYLPHYQVTTVFTSARIAAEEPDLVKAFLGAYSKGVADYNAAMIAGEGGEAARDAVVEVIHKYVYSDQPLEKAAGSIIAGTMRLNEGAALNMESVQDQLDWFKSEGMVDDGITIETLVDPSYVEIIGG